MGRDVWVDRFRPVAAAMVVAIHTAPLAEVSPVLGEAVVYGVLSAIRAAAAGARGKGAVTKRREHERKERGTE